MWTEILPWSGHLSSGEASEREACEALIERVCRQDQRFLYLVRSGPDPWLQVELTMPQLKALFLVHGLRSATMGTVASHLGVGLSTATGLVDRLVDQHLVRREDDRRDRRIVRVLPTEEGEALVAQVCSAGQDRMRVLLRRLSLDELRLVADALDLLYQAAKAEFESQGGSERDAPVRAETTVNGGVA